MAGKVVTLAEVRVGSRSVFLNGDGRWMVRAFYEVVDGEGKVRGSGWFEMEPGVKVQGQLQALEDGLVAAIRTKEL